MSIKFARFAVSLLIASLLTSCSASRHAGVATINEPPLSEDNQLVWFDYYEDQFDALEGNVLSPGSEYPDPARKGYDQAKDEWNKRMKSARGKTTLAYISGGLIIGAGVIYVLALLLKHDNQPGVE